MLSNIYLRKDGRYEARIALGKDNTGKRQYAEHGATYERNEQIMPELITGSNTGIIRTRARKAFEQQTERTRRRAEVFTPLWICKKMTEHFYIECASGQDADKLINSRQLEITCGEAPFLVSRYDTTTGEPIPIAERIGLLDRKLQLAGKIAENEADWLNLARRAFESTYGYEFQGDNLLIARVNLIETFSEYMQECCHRKPTLAEMRSIINIITWNVWQMDGLNGRIPYKTADEDNVQLSFFEEEKTAPEQPPCKIFDWRARRPLEYDTMGKGNKTMKFDFVIGIIWTKNIMSISGFLQTELSFVCIIAYNHSIIGLSRPRMRLF